MEVGVGDGVTVGGMLFCVGVNAGIFVNSRGASERGLGSRPRKRIAIAINTKPITMINAEISVIGLKIAFLPVFLE